MERALVPAGRGILGGMVGAANVGGPPGAGLPMRGPPTGPRCGCGDGRAPGPGAVGVPRRDKWNAFSFSAMSTGKPPGRTVLGEGAGRRAALMPPSGVEDLVMLGEAEESEEIRMLGSRAGGAGREFSAAGSRDTDCDPCSGG